MIPPMRSSTSLLLALVLLAAAGYGALADDLASTSQPPSWHWIDFRLAAGPGAFLYPQRVEGGYYIGGYPYDLSWYGLLGEVTGIIELSVPALKGVGLGIGGCASYVLNPAAVDGSYHFMVRADSGAPGFYGGLSASYGFGAWRVNGIAGYGGTGVDSYYGGTGPALSLGLDYSLLTGTIRAGIGARYLLAYLYHAGSSTVRSEQGLSMGFSVSAVVDWVP